MSNLGNWPVILRSEEITLRPLRLRDRKKWHEVRRANQAWLEPWEATLPQVPGEDGLRQLPTFFEMVGSYNKEGRAMRSLSLIIWYQDQLVGQISMGGIILGALRGAHIGYWVAEEYANKGITTKAVEMLSEFSFAKMGLHRIEINLRPENVASQKVAQKAGYHLEGERPRYLHIDGQWRDHLCFVRENREIL